MKTPRFSKFAARGPIGVDPGAGTLRLVQLDESAAGIRVHAAASQEYMPGDSNSWREAIARALHSCPFAGRRVVAGLPWDVLHVRTVRIPASVPNASIRKAASSEAAKLFPFPLDSAVVQCLPTDDLQSSGVTGVDFQREIIVLAAPRCQVDALVDDLHAAGVIVESLDAGPLAMCRAARSSIQPTSGAQVLLDVGERQTQVVIGRAGVINFIKSIDVGAFHFDQAVVRKLNAAPAEARLIRMRVAAGEDAAVHAGVAHDGDAVNQAVADSMRGTLEQLSRTLALYLKYHAITFRGPGPSCIHLMGPEADNQLLRALLSSSLGHPVVTIDPFLAFSDPAPRASVDESAGPSDKLSAGNWALATGLALKKLPVGRQASNLPPVQAKEVTRA